MRARFIGPAAAAVMIEEMLRREAAGGAVAVLWLDQSLRVLDAFVVKASHDEVEEVAAAVLDAPVSPVAAVVIGSWLPEGQAGPDDDDRRRFRQLELRHAEVGVELLEWFVLDGRLRLVSVNDVGREGR